MQAQQGLQHRDRHEHPVVVVEADDVQLLAELIRLCHGLLGVDDGNEAAHDADVEHVVLHLLALCPEEEGEQGDVRSADVDEPAVAQHACFVHGVGRNEDLQEVQQQAQGQEAEEHALLYLRGAVAQKEVQPCYQTGAENDPEEIPAIQKSDVHDSSSIGMMVVGVRRMVVNARAAAIGGCGRGCGIRRSGRRGDTTT